MKALVFTAPNEMMLRDEPEPAVDHYGADTVRVRVFACGICGSDMHAFHGLELDRKPPPLILGHEAAGVIVDGPRAGERVAINPLMPCRVCDRCETGREHLCSGRQVLSLKGAPGAFAEIVAVPSRNAIAIPDAMSFRTAALTEPLAVAYHAVNMAERLLPRPLSAQRCSVIGGGAIGLATAQVLASRGVGPITISEPSGLRRKTIARGGRFGSYDPNQAAKAPADASADVVFDAYGGASSRTEACRLVAPGGVVVHIGLESGADGLDVRKLTLQEIAFVGTYCYTMADFKETLDALADDRFGAFDWLEYRPLEDGVAAFADLDARRVEAAKIMLEM